MQHLNLLRRAQIPFALAALMSAAPAALAEEAAAEPQDDDRAHSSCELALSAAQSSAKYQQVEVSRLRFALAKAQSEIDEAQIKAGKALKDQAANCMDEGADAPSKPRLSAADYEKRIARLLFSLAWAENTRDTALDTIARLQGQLAGASSTGSHAASPAASGTSAKTYKVRANDTLGSIAARVLGNGDQWRRIYDANKGQLKDPDQLVPGMTLQIP